MSISSDGVIRITPPGAAWELQFQAARILGPSVLTVGGDEFLRNVQEEINELPADGAISEQFRSGRSGGAAEVAMRGYLPYGNQLRLSQQAVIAANHARFTVDFTWPARTAVRRHFALGVFSLPGRWRRFFLVPPGQHLAEGAIPAWRDIPEKAPAAGAAPLLLGHWHRPPLALVLERPDGRRLELGAGSDLWRWEHSLGYGPESGSYKLFQDADGLRLLREPLMCCEEFMPAARKYRFTWYAAWGRGAAAVTPAAAAVAVAPAEIPDEALDETLDETGLEAAPPKAPAAANRLLAADGSLDSAVVAQPAATELVLDFADLPVRDLWRRCPSPAAYGRNQRTQPCWEADGTQKLARTVIRRLAALRPDGGRLCIRNLQPGPCWDPAHVEKKQVDGLAHWDINSIFDFAEWTRKTLGPSWDIRPEWVAPWNELPALAGLFAPNGFDAE